MSYVVSNAATHLTDYVYLNLRLNTLSLWSQRLYSSIQCLLLFYRCHVYNAQLMSS